MKPSSSAALPEAVIHGLSVGLAQTATTTRPPGPRHTRHLRGDPLHVGDEHDPEATEDGVDRIVREGQRGGVLDREADAVEPELLRTAATRLDHLRRDVGRDQLAVRQEAWQCREADLAGTGRQLEHALPGLRVEQLDHPGGQAAVERAKRSRRRSQPPATLRQASTWAAASSAIAATSLNAGMICSP